MPRIKRNCSNFNVDFNANNSNFNIDFSKKESKFGSAIEKDTEILINELESRVVPRRLDDFETIDEEDITDDSYLYVDNNGEDSIKDYSWNQAIRDLGNGNLGCMAVGSWAVSTVQDVSTNPNDIGYMPFPNKINKQQYASIIADYCIGISRNTKYPELEVKKTGTYVSNGNKINIFDTIQDNGLENGNIIIIINKVD